MQLPSALAASRWAKNNPEARETKNFLFIPLRMDLERYGTEKF